MKIKTPKLVKFWAYNPETCRPFRACLRDYESISFYVGGKTDEGHSQKWIQITREDDRLLYEETSQGSDCDGSHSTEWLGTCPIPVPVIRRQWGDDGRYFNVPDFQRVSHF